MGMFIRQVETNKAYTIADSLMTAYERGEVRFETRDGVTLTPSCFGRAGGGFHAMFVVANAAGAIHPTRLNMTRQNEASSKNGNTVLL